MAKFAYQVGVNRSLIGIHAKDNSEQAPTSAPSRMNGKCSGNSFLLGSSSLANHSG
jgi:hypothetical protein